MTAFNERVEKAVAIERRANHRRTEAANVANELGALASIAAINSPVGLAVVINGEIRWASDVFASDVGCLASEIAERVDRLRPDQPTSLMALLDMSPGDSRSEVLLYGGTTGSVMVVASMAGSAHSSHDGECPRLDPVTGLPDQSEIEDLLSREFVDEAIGVILIEVDSFGDPNNRHGHGAGDEVLREVARRLLVASRTGDAVYRYRGDRFVILGRDLATATAEYDSTMSTRLEAAVSSTPITLEDDEIFVTISAGVGHAETSADVRATLEQVDAAMSRTKRADASRSHPSTSQESDDITADERMAREVHGAIRAGKFELLYQPIVALDSGETFGHEALLRLILPDDVLIAPAQFLDHAAEAGMMNAVDEWVLARAIGDLAQGASRHPRGVSINLSPSILESGTLPQYVEGLIATFDVDPELLVLEFTESTILSDQADVGAQLEQLAASGVRIALDNFGTEYSNLTQLSDMKIDVIKLDKKFVSNVDTEGGYNASAQVVIAIADTLGCDVVAEGIERSEQRVALLELGCRYGQGFYFGQPASLPRRPPES